MPRQDIRDQYASVPPRTGGETTAGSGADRERLVAQQTRLLRAMYEAGRRFAATLEPEEIYDALRQLVYDSLPGCDGLIISTYHEPTCTSRCQYIWVQRRLDGSLLPPLVLDPAGAGMQSEVVRAKRGRLFADIVERTKGPGRYYDIGPDGAPRDLKAEGADPPGARCALMVPILRDDHVEGIVQVMSDTANAYTDEHLAMLEGLVSPIGIALRNAELYASARREIEERRHAEAALQESESRLSLAQKVGGIGVWDWDSRSGETYWSDTMWEIYGHRPHPDGPADGLWESCLHPQDRDRVRDGIERILASKASEYRAEFRILRTDGAIRWIEAIARLERDEAGRPRRMYGVNVDITGRKEAEETLRVSAREKDEFLAMLGHELRNPLAPIQNAAHVLEAIGPQSPEAVQMRAMIQRQVTHMSRMLDDLLDVARIARDKLRLQPQRCDLSAIVRDVVEDHREPSQAEHLSVRVVVPEAPMWVDGDPTRLAQVVGNLVHNARKFTDPGGVIDIRLDPAGGTAVLRVRDSGIGIERDALPLIFEAFSQGGQGLDRSRSGLGLGLAVARGLVELHGGSLVAESDGAGRGATFTARLPLQEQAGVSDAVRRVPHAAKGGLRVLVIEDNLDTADSQAALLRLRGHDVEVAYSASEGLARAREFGPDVVLCDIGLPGRDGYSVAQALRKDPRTHDAYLIAQSGYGQERDRLRAQEAGFDLHLRKPVDPAKLDQILAHRLEALARA